MRALQTNGENAVRYVFRTGRTPVYVQTLELPRTKDEEAKKCRTQTKEGNAVRYFSRTERSLQTQELPRTKDEEAKKCRTRMHALQTKEGNAVRYFSRIERSLVYVHTQKLPRMHIHTHTRRDTQR